MFEIIYNSFQANKGCVDAQKEVQDETDIFKYVAGVNTNCPG
jgi:hypothetical protein